MIDAGQLDRLVSKWSPLLAGLDKDQTPLVAWIFERESRSTNAYRASRGRQFGKRLRVDMMKRTFPALRLAIVALFPSSAVDRLARVASYPQPTASEVREAVLGAQFLVADAQIAIAIGSSTLPADQESVTHINALAERTMESIRAYIHWRRVEQQYENDPSR